MKRITITLLITLLILLSATLTFAGTPPTLIAHYKMNEDTEDDNDELVTNGSAPTNLTGWTQSPGTQWSIVGNEFRGAGNTADNFLYQDFGVVVGRKYKFSYEVTDNSLVGGTSANQIALSSVGSFGATVLSSDVGTQTYYLLATQDPDANLELRMLLSDNATGGTIDLDNISIQLLAVEDSSGKDYDGLAQRDTGGTGGADSIHRAGKINGAFDFNGSSDYIEIGDTESDVKSIAVWCNPDGVGGTDSLLDLNGTDYITIVTGTVTKNGFSGGTKVIYIDSIVASTVTANWHFIVLTSTAGFDADDLDIGRKATGYFNGLIDNVIFFSVELSPDEVKRLYNNRNGTEILTELDSVISPRRSNASPLGWRARYEW